MRNFALPGRRLSPLIISLLLLATLGCTVPVAPQAPAAPTAVVAAPSTATAVSSTTVQPTRVARNTPTTRATTRPTRTARATAPPTATAEPTPPPTATAEPTPTEVALQPFDPALAATLQSMLDQTVADGYIPGAVLAVSVPGVEPWTGASGIINQQQGQLMQSDTRVRVASISKIFTAVVMLQLAEEGQIDLAAPVALFFPDLVPNGDTMTVRHLLNHTSGLYDYLEDPRFGQQPYIYPDRVFEPREMVAYAAQFPSAFAPGTPGFWDYSSTNYVILGMIIEQVTGTPLNQVMQQRIFIPLGLTNTFFAPADPVDGVLASGYSNAADLTNTSMSFVFATANIVSTVDDIRRFAVALFGGELLEPETLALMQTFENGNGSYNMPELEYGLGIMRNRLPISPGPDGQARPTEVSRVLGHIGGFGGFRSAVWYAPENGITISLAVNQFATDPNRLATQAFDAVLTQQGR